MVARGSRCAWSRLKCEGVARYGSRRASPNPECESRCRLASNSSPWSRLSVSGHVTGSAVTSQRERSRLSVKGHVLV
eukprot:513329-Rhodomonas_salina.1